MKALGWVVPVVLGVLAAIMYYGAARSSIRPIELVGVSQNVRAGTELTEEMLTRVTIRADRAIVRSVLRWEDRGLVFGRRVGRSLVEGELVLFADVRQPAGEAQSNLRPGETSVTLSVPSNRVVPGARIGDEVLVLVYRDPIAGAADPADKGKAIPTGERAIGPFRIVGFGDRSESPAASRDDPRGVVVAVRIKPETGVPADQAGKELVEAARGSRGEKLVAVEYPGPTRAGK